MGATSPCLSTGASATNLSAGGPASGITFAAAGSA